MPATTEGPFWVNVHHANKPQSKVPQVAGHNVQPGKSYSTLAEKNPHREGEQ